MIRSKYNLRCYRKVHVRSESLCTLYCSFNNYIIKFSSRCLKLKGKCEENFLIEEDFFKLGVEVALQLAFPPWMRHEMEGGRQEQHHSVKENGSLLTF